MFYLKDESVGHFNTIAKLDLFMRINEIYPRDNLKKDFVFELSMDWKFTSLDSKFVECLYILNDGVILVCIGSNEI